MADTVGSTGAATCGSGSAAAAWAETQAGVSSVRSSGVVKSSSGLAPCCAANPSNQRMAASASASGETVCSTASGNASVTASMGGATSSMAASTGVAMLAATTSV